MRAQAFGAAAVGVCACLGLALTATPPAFAGANKALKKPVKLLIGGVRYKKFKIAMKMLDTTAMATKICGAHWAKLSAPQKKEVEKRLRTILMRSSFVKARKVFKYIDAVLYSKPKINGATASLKTTIVIHRSYKKKELEVTWILKKGKGWRVVDTIVAGDSTLKGIHDEEVKPLLKKGGTALLLSTLKKKVAAL